MSEYRRLTERSGNGIAIKETSTNDNMSIWNAIERLAELEDKIENGTLVELPCKVGDIVYKIFGEKVYEMKAVAIPLLISPHGTHLSVSVENHRHACLTLEYGDFDKTVFLTEAEAEAKLKEIKGEV